MAFGWGLINVFGRDSKDDIGAILIQGGMVSPGGTGEGGAVRIRYADRVSIQNVISRDADDSGRPILVEDARIVTINGCQVPQIRATDCDEALVANCRVGHANGIDLSGTRLTLKQGNLPMEGT